MLQRRRIDLFALCFTASLALHLVLLALAPAWVHESAPPNMRVLDVVIVRADPPARAFRPSMVEPEPAAPRDAFVPQPAPRKERVPRSETKSAPARRPKDIRAPAPTEPARGDTSREASASLQTAPPARQTPPAAQTAEEAAKTRGAVPSAPPSRIAALTPPAFTAEYLQNPPPRYPLIARRNGEQGTVTLRVLVDRDGVPALVSVEHSSGSRHLDTAALETVKTWRFTPARQGGEPIEAWVLVPIVFRLEGTS